MSEKRYTSLFEEHAIEDQLEAALWLQRFGKADEFEQALRAALNEALLFPEAGIPTTFARVRRKTIVGFPYHLVYLIEANVLVVVAIAHQRRDPKFWQRRLE